MTEYNFTFIVTGIDVNSDTDVGRILESGCDDSTLSLIRGLTAMTFDREAASYDQAVLSAYDDVLNSGAEVKRFEPDYLVSAAEIASRVGVTRSAVSHWIKGDRGVEFPHASHRIDSCSPLWDWVDISTWLCINKKLGEPEVRHAQVSRAVNAYAQLGPDAFGGIKVGALVERLLEAPITAKLEVQH